MINRGREICYEICWVCTFCVRNRLLPFEIDATQAETERSVGEIEAIEGGDHVETETDRGDKYRV